MQHFLSEIRRLSLAILRPNIIVPIYMLRSLPPWRVTTATGIAVLTILGGNLAASATDVTFSFDKTADGTAPFDNDSNPGNDSGENNNIVRTQDLIEYKWRYAVNNGNANNVVLTARVPPEQEFPVIPPVCKQPGSSLTVDAAGNQTISCNIGTVTSGSAGEIIIKTRVLGQRRAPVNSYIGNGQTTSGTIGSFKADELAQPNTTTNVPTITISATPKADLFKEYAYVEGTAKGSDGVTDGLVIRYPIMIAVGGSGKGSEALDSTIQFTDQLLVNDGSGNPVAGTRLYTWATDGHSGCNWMGADPYSAYGSHPYGKKGYVGYYGQTYYSQPDRWVGDSGNWTCTQSAPGAPINFTITGADTTGNVSPTKSIDGYTLPANRTYLVSGTLHLWVPVSTVTAAGGQLNVRNRLSPLTTQSVSGRANVEPTTANNNYDHTLVSTSGYFTSHFATDVNARGTPLPGMSGIYGGDGSVMPTQTFTDRLYLYNNGALPWATGAILCTAIDNKVEVVEALPGTPNSAIANFSSGGLGTNYVFEYGTGNYATVLDHKKATCRDQDSPNGWYTDLTSVPGGADAVSKVRVRAIAPVLPGYAWDIAVNLRSRNYYQGTTTQMPIGTLLTQHSSFYIKDYPWVWQGEPGMPTDWYAGFYQRDNNYYVGWGDRLTLTRAIVRVDKQNVPDIPTKPILAGDRTTFKLKSTVTASINPPPVNPLVILKDILPAGTTYVAGSANIAPTSIISNADGTTTLVWNLGTRVPNQPIPDITFDANVRPDAANNSILTNTATIESDDDASLLSARTDSASLSIGNAAAFRIFKTVEKVVVEKDEQVKYSLFYANTGSTSVGKSQFIDILPHGGDGRIPATSFIGTSTFASISGNNGETFEFTSRLAAQIVADPDDSSNQNGSTKWCTFAQFGNTVGCPNSNADITAIRINAAEFPKNDPTREIKLVLNPLGNNPGNTYTNQFTGRAIGLLGMLKSNDVFAKVRLPAHLVLVKRITKINSTNFTQIIDDSNTLDDNDPGWPSNYLQGVTQGEKIKPGDTIEYTIYYLSNGDTAMKDVNLCDLIPTNSSYLSNGLQTTPTPFGIGLEKNQTFQLLTDDPTDSDGGSYITSGGTTPITCNVNTAPNGAVLVKVGNLSYSGYGGTKPAAYGLMRFKVKVMP